MSMVIGKIEQLSKPSFADLCARNKEAGEAATRAWWAQREREIALETFGPLERYMPANDNWPKVIAFTGKAGSGKSTAAKYVIERGYKLVKFADPLKDMLRAIGYSQRQIEGDLKEVPDASGQTPRHAMQTLGTEWGRKCMGEDFWINIWRERVTGATAVTDDCRFANEADAVRSVGGIVVMLKGRGGINSAHSSELLDFKPDIVIANDGNITSLHSRIDEILAA
ncbi:deoxynucleotide monophosphate kinase [Ochrobactrum sp. S1502_03]|uniref:deoxynucleotide monophosphate kinase family protein n=1 Tax=Ochrobactrum sp. S1502_03 TaxID=3108451 RepID=UPI0037C7E950